ncbi:zinc finger BED domain-containing protein DAYSLEEPER-like [Prosopis cineraria]|uniref:zinc finger BED domain-containing protein DAYSLEEPER-like n=1 Tax=Prosopis cineraria TaxID=364024 RepID=UPI00240F7825|nr:zinc finger BED domain-containing protein DAYSLEEPER-like [Prosopis cineraria]
MTYAFNPSCHGTHSLLRHIPKYPKNPHKATKDKKQVMINLLSSGTSGQGKSIVTHLYDEKRCRRALAEFIICDEQSFRIVEKPAFKKLLNEFEPRFPIPSRTTIARDVWQLYLGEVKVLKKILKQCSKRVYLTTDYSTLN